MGCKYDPFGDRQRQPIRSLETKVGTVDLRLLEHIFDRTAFSLTAASTINELDNLLYMFDYIYAVTPTFIEPHKNKMANRKFIISILQLLDMYEFPVNTLLRAVAVHADVTQTSTEYLLHLSRISMFSQTQKIKRDADRDLLERCCANLVARAYDKMAFFDHNTYRNQILKRGYRTSAFYNEQWIALNCVLKDLLDPSITVDAKTTAKDLEIINNFMAVPTITLRLFTSMSEARQTLG
jgi:hypothetical protein